MNKINERQMLLFDIVRLDNFTDTELFSFCMALNACIEEVAEDVVLYNSNKVGVGTSSYVGCWCSYENNEINKFQNLKGFGEAVVELQKRITDAMDKHFISIAVSPSEVSYQIFDREKALQYLIKEIGHKSCG